MSRIINLYKNAYSGLSPATWWLSLVMLINRSGTMVVPFITLYLTQSKHYSISDAGIVMATFGAGAVAGGLMGGKLTDIFGFYNVQLGALLCGGVLFIVLGQMESFQAILSCTFLLAMLNDSFRPANSTAIAQYSKEENRTRSFSLNRLSINLGWALGGALGGFIASKNYHLLFWIDGLTNIFAAILLRAVLSPSKNTLTPATKGRKKLVVSRLPYQDPMYLFFILLTILFGCMFFQIFSTLPVFFNQVLYLSPFYIGIVMSFNGMLIAVFEMALVFKLEVKNKNTQFITIGVILIGCSFVMFNILPGALNLALTASFILTIGEMLTMPFMNSFWIRRTDNTNRGQYAGLYTVAWSVAQIAGPLAGSQIADHFSFSILWWVVGGLSIVTATGFRFLK
jgi:predicted MFS family arabinose efflux permease